MPIDVVMPQMGESIAEGTVIKWMKKVGDTVERDEPLFEISTDKVDAEIPSPAAGTLSEILAEEGKTVAVNSVVARLSAAGESAATGDGVKQAPKPSATAEQKPLAAKPPAQPTAPPAQQSKTPQPASGEQKAANAATANDVAAEAGEAITAAPDILPAVAVAGSSPAAREDSQEKVTSLEERRRTRSSPLVRKIAKEKDIDISQVQGSGASGRVTKKDILQFIETPESPEAPASPGGVAVPQSARPSMFSAGQDLVVEPMTMMRKRIAEHMVLSKRTSAHVTTVFEVDFTPIEKLRRKHKDAYAQRGAKLTYLPFIIQAVIAAIREFPVLNASIDGDNVVYRKEINLGIAVALEWGLIVPVVRHADEKNVLGLARAVNDLGERARTKKLSPDEVQGGTFTITNPGIFGGLFGTPIINQPQVAILGVGGVKKRPVVIETPEGDAIVIRSMAYLALTFDHRLIDGAVADQFMARVRAILEAGQFSL